ncbi:MAG: XRE family transcriptional regulator [Proteobacteria bacterium]|jgi:transcriptional regulator with XRE-family HTH domain|nr:helix-turn-helix transcriptional regulator [Alphaproteobacteria bacterium]NCC03432.1 XRE family transcriptional regulator [Pseudomonadota bacterium]
MITGKQIRAARMLVEWDAQDLADKTGLTSETIFKIERGTTNARPATLERIIKAFNEGGVEFNGERGVNLVLEDYRLIEGADCYLKLLDEIYYELRGKKDAQIEFICIDDTVSVREVVESNFRIRNAGIRCRYLCSENAKKFDYPIEDYRAISKEHFKNSVMVVYGDKVAILRGTSAGVLVMRDKDHAEMLRGLFEIIWDQAPMPISGSKK